MSLSKIVLSEKDLFVIDDPIMEDFKIRQLENFWTAVDLEFENDDLTKVPERFLESLAIVMNMFVTMDKTINDQYLSKLEFKVSDSASRFHHIQMAIEDVHHEVYTKIVKHLGVDYVLSKQGTISEALDFGLGIPMEDKTFALHMLAVLEGFHFSFVFTLFLMMRTLGFMTEACKANEFILKDEYLHCAGWLNLLKRDNVGNSLLLEETIEKSHEIQLAIVESLPLTENEKEIFKAILAKFRNSFSEMAESFSDLDLKKVEENEELIAPYISSIVIPTRTKFMDTTASGMEYTNASQTQNYDFLDNFNFL